MKSNTKWASKYYRKNTISIIQVDKTGGYPKMSFTLYLIYQYFNQDTLE